MLRDFFPSTNEGAKVYGGFMHHNNCFCRTFDCKENFKDSIKEINIFLEDNGYEISEQNEFDETYSYTKNSVSISRHGYKEQFVVLIERDAFSKPQSNFLTNELKKFRNQRDWEQFHNPKDLSLALNIETSELLELFLWKNHEDADKEKIKEELADVFAYAFLLAEKYNLDVEEIVLNKMKQNAEKYPVNKSKGIAKKYTDL